MSHKITVGINVNNLFNTEPYKHSVSVKYSSINIPVLKVNVASIEK